MSESTPSELPPMIVHALLVCRNVEMAEEGRLDLKEVLEVIALDEMPGDAGPLTFVAFVRGVPPGTCTFHFVARYPLQVQVDEAWTGRQLAVQMRVPDPGPAGRGLRPGLRVRRRTPRRQPLCDRIEGRAGVRVTAPRADP